MLMLIRDTMWLPQMDLALQITAPIFSLYKQNWQLLNLYLHLLKDSYQGDVRQIKKNKFSNKEWYKRNLMSVWIISLVQISNPRENS